MRQIIFFLLVTFVLLSNCNDNEEQLTQCVKTQPTKNDKKTCNNNAMPKNMKCCYVEYTLGNTEYYVCSAIIDTEKEIKEYKDMLKDASGVDIQCTSSFISISLWLIVLVFGII